MRISPIAVIASLWLCLAVPSHADDRRMLVAMPEAARQSLLLGMQNHMAVLSTLLSYIANERFEQAAQLADAGLRIGPFDSEVERDAATYFPPEMRDAGDSLREAGRRLAVAARKAEADRSYYRMRRLAGAVDEVAATCNMCHAYYRIR